MVAALYFRSFLLELGISPGIWGLFLFYFLFYFGFGFIYFFYTFYLASISFNSVKRKGLSHVAVCKLYFKYSVDLL